MSRKLDLIGLPVWGSDDLEDYEYFLSYHGVVASRYKGYKVEGSVYRSLWAVVPTYLMPEERADNENQ